MKFALLVALWAEGNPVREALLLQVLKAGIVARKLLIEIADRVPQVSRNRFSGGSSHKRT